MAEAETTGSSAEGYGASRKQGFATPDAAAKEGQLEKLWQLLAGREKDKSVLDDPRAANGSLLQSEADCSQDSRLLEWKSLIIPGILISVRYRFFCHRYREYYRFLYCNQSEFCNANDKSNWIKVFIWRRTRWVFFWWPRCWLLGSTFMLGRNFMVTLTAKCYIVEFLTDFRWKFLIAFVQKFKPQT
jgi:hypothetical protein